MEAARELSIAQRGLSARQRRLDTLSERWSPRSEPWLRRPLSQFAGRPNRPLFIGGCPRSGTTLLRSLLNNHPDLAMPPETDFVIPVWTRRSEYGDLRRPDNRRRLAEWILNTPGHGGRRIRAGMPIDDARERLARSAPTLGSMFASCYRLYAEAHGKSRWGDKRPAYANYLGMLFDLFPDAQFINLVRDPRAAVSSLIGIEWFPGDDALEAGTAMWEASIRNVDRFSRRLRPDQLLDVRYEDLVRYPERTLGEICEFAGLQAGGAIAQMIGRKRAGRFREGWHERLSEPITTSRIDSWKQALRPTEAALIENALGLQMERFGYDATLRRVSPDPAAIRELARQRRRRARRWRRFALGELRRRIAYRPPVAAVAR